MADKKKAEKVTGRSRSRAKKAIVGTSDVGGDDDFVNPSAAAENVKSGQVTQSMQKLSKDVIRKRFQELNVRSEKEAGKVHTEEPESSVKRDVHARKRRGRKIEKEDEQKIVVKKTRRYNTMLTRTSPLSLFTAIKKLNAEQRDKVTEMGFGSLLKKTRRYNTMLTRTSPLDGLFETKDGRHASREIFESMLLTTAIAADVINVWSYILNHEERRKNKDSPSRLFFGTDILMDYLITKEKVTNKELYDSFLGGLHAASNGNGETSTLKKIDMVFFPVHKTNHFYLIVFNLKSPEFLIIDNIVGDANISSQYGKTPTVFKRVLLHHLKAVQHPRFNSVGKLRARRLRMQWRTLFNGVDCGIFVMHHMETYMDESDAKWNCGLVNESNEQEEQLNKLRGKYLAKLLLSGVNLKRDLVIMQAEAFASRDSSEQRNILDYAFENRHVRFSQLCPSSQS